MGKRSSIYLTNGDLARIAACDLTPIVLIRMGLDAFEAVHEKLPGAHTRRPTGLIPGSGRAGEPKALRSSLEPCPHPKARRSKGGLCMACGANVGNAQ